MFNQDPNNVVPFGAPGVPAQDQGVTVSDRTPLLLQQIEQQQAALNQMQAQLAQMQQAQQQAAEPESLSKDELQQRYHLKDAHLELGPDVLNAARFMAQQEVNRMGEQMRSEFAAAQARDRRALFTQQLVAAYPNFEAQNYNPQFLGWLFATGKKAELDAASRAFNAQACAEIFREFDRLQQMQQQFQQSQQPGQQPGMQQIPGMQSMAPAPGNAYAMPSQMQAPRPQAPGFPPMNPQNSQFIGVPGAWPQQPGMPPMAPPQQQFVAPGPVSPRPVATQPYPQGSGQPQIYALSQVKEFLVGYERAQRTPEKEALFNDIMRAQNEGRINPNA